MPLIGNKRHLAFDLVPVEPSWERRYLPEKAAWAGTAVWVGGFNLCAHIFPGSNDIHEYFYIPLIPITDWLVQSFPYLKFQERSPYFPGSRQLHESVNRWAHSAPPAGMDEFAWIESREAWWMRHFLRAGADGARCPDLAFAREDEDLVVSWGPPRFYGVDAPDVLHPVGHFAMPWQDAIPILDEFAAVVAEWVRGSGLTEAFPWAQHLNPLFATPVSLERAIELLTGRGIEDVRSAVSVDDPTQFYARLGLGDFPEDPAASPQCQMLRDLSPRLAVDVATVVMDVGTSALERGPKERTAAWLHARALARDAASSASNEMEAGQLAAIELRREMDLDSQPIIDVADTLDLFGVSSYHTDVRAGHDRMVVAGREDGSLVTATFDTPRTQTDWGRRFEGCRALGHLLLDPIRSGTIGAASGPFAQETRRRRSGAFAAEFLLPESAIAAASQHVLDGAANEDVFRHTMKNYGIGAQAAAYQMWNRGWLSSEMLRDDLTLRSSAEG